MITVIPSDQKIYVSSYFQNLFEFGNAPDDVRICRYLNHLLDLFGEDLVISGGRVESVDINGSNLFTIMTKTGRLIQDKTLISFDAFTLDKDLTGYLGVGAHAIVYTDFQYNDSDRNVSVDPNIFFFRAGIVDASGTLVGATWNNDTNRILMSAYDIDNATFKSSLTINGTIFYSLGWDETKYNYYDFVDGGDVDIPDPLDVP